MVEVPALVVDCTELNFTAWLDWTRLLERDDVGTIPLQPATELDQSGLTFTSPRTTFEIFMAMGASALDRSNIPIIGERPSNPLRITCFPKRLARVHDWRHAFASHAGMSGTSTPWGACSASLSLGSSDQITSSLRRGRSSRSGCPSRPSSSSCGQQDDRRTCRGAPHGGCCPSRKSSGRVSAARRLAHERRDGVAGVRTASAGSDHSGRPEISETKGVFNLHARSRMNPRAPEAQEKPRAVRYNML